MKKYELLLVLPGTLDEKEAEVRSGEILAIIKEFATDAELHSMGKMRLAYPIKQIRYGYYYTIVFGVEPIDLKAIQTKLSLTRDLLRAMITEYNAKYNPVQKLNYVTNSIGVTTASEEKIMSEAPKIDVKVSMQDINKKLDEILSGEIIAGV